MAIGAGAAGAWAATNATTHTVTLPAHAAGDLLVVIAACKAAAITSVNPDITTPTSGWARVASFADGTTNAGNGTGSVHQAIFYKIAASGSETNPVVTWGGAQTAAPGIAVGLGFTKASGEAWVTPAVVQKATNAATSISVTMDSNPGITAGDWGVIAHTTADESALTVPTWTATSATLGTVAVYPVTPISSTTSNDMAGTSAYRAVTSGTASAAPVVTGTQAAAETGTTCFIRLRVVTEPAGTTVYPTNTASAVSTASTDYEVWTSRGGSFQEATASTVTGPTAPIQFQHSGAVVDWFTRQLAGFTLGTAVRASPRAHVSSLANVVVVCEIARVDSDGTNPTVWGTTASGELSNTGSATPLIVSGNDLAISGGQRLRVRFYIDDTSAMATGQSATVTFSGPTGGAAGDTYLTFTQTLTEFSAGTTVTPTTAALVITPFVPVVTATSSFPQVIDADTKNGTQTSDSTSWTLTYPTNLVSGDLIVALMAIDGNITTTPTFPTGWSGSRITSNSAVSGVVVSKLSDGTETGTFGVTVPASEQGAWRIFRITGAYGTSVAASTYGTNNIGTSTTPTLASTNPDTWDIEATLWIVACMADTSRTISVYPYADRNTADVSGGTGGATLGVCTTESATASLSPGTFTISSSDEWASWTHAIRPAAPVGNITVTPTTKAVVLTKNIPTVTASNHQSVTPTTKALVSATFAPQARTPILATPAAVSLTVTKFAPTVTTSNNQRVTPTTATLTATKYAPTVTTPERVTPTTKALALATFAPTVTVAAGAISVTVPKATLTLATFAPTIRLAIRVTPNAVSLITSPQVPTVTASDFQRVTPTTKALVLSTFAPTVTTPSPQLVTPTTAALVATKYAPIVGTRYYAAVQATGPLAWWRLGEPSGTVSDDEIGSANADYVNTPTLGVASLLSGDTNTSVTFSRASLEHTSANTNMPAGSSAGFSAKGWVRFATVTAATRYPIVRWFGGTGAPDTQLYYNVAVGAWRYLYQDATGFRNTHSDAWSPSTATTYFIVVTHDYSAETVKFYVNGTLLSTEDVSVNGVPVVHAAGSSASVGRAASDYWDGTIDEVALYNGVLTPTQILALYNAGSGAAGPQLVTPATASLIVTKYQPTVTTPQTFTPTTASLVATKYAPTVRLPILATPTTKALTVTRYEPTVRLHQLVTPAKATLTATRFAPTVTTPIRAVPGTKALALTPFAPVVTAGNVQSVTPTTAVILLTKYVPVVSVTAHLAVVPPAATLTVTKFAPTVSATAHVAVIPAVKPLIVAPQVPTVALTAHVAVIVPKATLTITRYEPSLAQTNDVVAIPTTKSLTLSALTPTVTATANVAFAPTTKAVTITKFAPTVRTPILATPATRALTTTRFTPQARTPLLATPTKKSLALTAYTPTVSSPVRVTPAKATLTTTRYAPTLVAPQTITVPPKSLGITTYAPTARVAYRFTPITASLTLASFAPSISTTFNAVVRPEYGELVITEYPPTLDISGHQGIVPGTAVLVITPYPPTAEQHSITPLPDLIYGFAIVAMGDSAGVGVENGGATVRSEGGGAAVLTSGPSAKVTIR